MRYHKLVHFRNQTKVRGHVRMHDARDDYASNLAVTLLREMGRLSRRRRVIEDVRLFLPFDQIEKIGQMVVFQYGLIVVRGRQRVPCTNEKRVG